MARKWTKATEADMERRLSVSVPSRLTVGDLLERYESEVIPTHKGSRREIYKSRTLRKNFSKIRLCDLSPSDVRQYRDIRLKTISPATLRRELAVLSSAINHASKEWGIFVSTNPVTAISVPRTANARSRRLEADEQNRLLSASNGELRRIIIIALETGMRRGEILQIRRSHIDFILQTLLIPRTKTDTPRTIPLSSMAVVSLKEQISISGNITPIRETPLFSLLPDSLSQAFRRLCRRLDIQNLHFHDLRHEATSRLFEKGLNPVEVATITGHKDTKMLMRYTHLRAEDLVGRLG
ncbi:MAG: tyrosine-type recombinase/integrase [Arenicellales bacterium]